MAKSLVSFLLIILPSFSLSFINDRPIIGILTEEVKTKFAPNATSYIMASYVKFLESSGARVVPVMIRQPQAYYEDLMNKINGVLFPGGGLYLKGSEYERAGRIIFNIAVKMNARGDVFPLWGTCLGFELLNLLAVNKDWMKLCDAHDLASNLSFVKGGFEDSRMFKDIDNKTMYFMQNLNTVINYHQWCLTPSNYSLSKLNKFFQVLATSKDSRGETYVSLIEAFNYPFYGSAFHPEKVLFEWVESETHQNIPHSKEAVIVSQHFSNFFVSQARKSRHSFPSKEAENDALIYNYNPVFTGKEKNFAAEQNYFFN